jgi:hypothetical protein
MTHIAADIARARVENAVKQQFRNHPQFASLVAWRFCSLYNFPPDEAINLIERRCFSPTLAMKLGLARQRERSVAYRPEIHRGDLQHARPPQ